MIFTVVGARPNFVKAAPILRAFEQLGVPHGLVHTGQHHDGNMSKVFFKDLNMPRPVVDLGVGSGTHAEQTGAVMVGLEGFFSRNKPRAIVVVGDVDSTLAAALVAAKMGIYCAHVEAGLRSGDWTMPEEVNRVVADAVSDLLLTPSVDADRNLAAEGCAADEIVRVGNVMIDSLNDHLPRARAIDVAGRFGLVSGGYAVLTLHRASNVDDPETLARILSGVARVAGEIPVLFPVHPRTRRQLAGTRAGNIAAQTPGLKLVDPLGYLNFLSLTSGARLVLTDSGGLQEETTVLGIPCVTLRENTERPITVEQGTSVLVGTEPDIIFREAKNILASGGKITRLPDLWDGHAAGRIARAIVARL